MREYDITAVVIDYIADMVPEDTSEKCEGDMQKLMGNYFEFESRLPERAVGNLESEDDLFIMDESWSDMEPEDTSANELEESLENVTINESAEQKSVEITLKPLYSNSNID